MNKTNDQMYPSSFSLKQYLKELLPYERYDFFEMHTKLDEFAWKKLKQKEQIELITNFVSDTKNLEKILIYAPEASIVIVKKLLNDKTLDENDIKNDKYYLFGNLIINNICNFLSVNKSKEEPSDYFIYDELMPLLKKMDLSKIEAKRKLILPIVSYIKPCINFYGILEIDDLIMIYRSQNADEQTDLQLTKYIKDYIRFNSDVYIRKNMLMHECNFMVKENFSFLWEHTQSKPFGILPKNELMKYEDEDYFEHTKTYKALVDFLLTQIKLDKIEIDSFILDMLMNFNYGINPTQITEVLNNPFVAKMKFETLNQYVSLLLDFYSNHRTWFNRGHSAKELFNKQIKK